jgi:hypothetical protein
METRRWLSADGESSYHAGGRRFSAAVHNYFAAKQLAPKCEFDVAANNALGLVGDNAVEINPARE